MSQRIIDLSHPIRTDMPPWPGTPPVEMQFLDQASRTTETEIHSNSTRFTMNIHCGTHMDAPYHFCPDGRPIDEVPLEWTYGLATLIRLDDRGAGKVITPEDLEPSTDALRRTGKAIIQNGWSACWPDPKFFEEYPELSVEAAELLVECGVHLVGLEIPSVDRRPNATHYTLLGANVLIVECLRNLEKIPGDEFLFSATPLNLERRDGSPVRAIAIVDD